MKNAIIKKKVFWIQVELESPLNISSGKEDITDSDVIRDYDGTLFVPASSLAGAMRAYLKKEKDEPCLFGYSKDNINNKNNEYNINSENNTDGKMSVLFLSDMNFEGNPEVSVRDGVELNEKKTAVTGSKYAVEIIEAETQASFYAELTIRQNDKTVNKKTNEKIDKEEEYKKDFAAIIKGIHTGEIRFGSKKTRGFGKLKICHIASREFNKNNYLEYANVYQDKEQWKAQKNEMDEWLALADKESQYLHLQVPLQLEGGISIRQYSAIKDDPDFVHITNSKRKAVIPGSSFAGAIRHRLKDILLKLKEQGLDVNVDNILNTMFGYVEKDTAHLSMIIISESKIEGAKALTMTRTGISRFESAAKDKTLFTEKTYVDGTVELNILIKKGMYKEQEWILGLLLLAVEDLRNGFLAVGGATAIGRGIFKENGAVLLDGKELNIHAEIAKSFQFLKWGIFEEGRKKA
ncbi:MAG: hypothetical protein HFJ03_03520 [Lachnospira sp.]|nr:hypothetical protein [Lachnospira sp.]